jgi:hypothetical protein
LEELKDVHLAQAWNVIQLPFEIERKVMGIFMRARGGGAAIVPATTCTLKSLGLMRPSTTHNHGSLWFKIYATCSKLKVNI